MPCTTILVGKNASYDGSTLMARNEDSGAGNFDPKKVEVIIPDKQPRYYKSVISGVEIELPDNPMRYTSVPNALNHEGIWGEAGFNEENIAMTETETITSNSRVLGADPLVKTGIGEEDMLTLVLPYIHSAREGVLRLGNLLETYGTYEMNGIGFQDINEIWWLESIGGHHWIAKRVPDDAYVVMPNQQGIDWFDFEDAYGKQEHHMCCQDMLNFIEKNHLDLAMKKNLKNFDIRAALGSHTDMDHAYNTPRAWYMVKCLNPKIDTYQPDSDDIPWSFVPEHKITIEDIKYVLSSYYQGTEYNPYIKYGDTSLAGKYRPIGINRNNFLAILQCRPYVKKEIQAVEWISMGCNAFNALVPFYANVNTSPEYVSNTNENVDTNNFYWINRMIGTLCDAHYNACHGIIDRYALKMHGLGHNFISESDEQVPENEVSSYLEACNEKMAQIAKEETQQLLNTILFVSSNEMKNAYSMSDA
ncbi:MAG: C69 family dipeptidase [Bacillota bacterium]|nr:C69 family dipeptidase [Bacillota bacterium]